MLILFIYLFILSWHVKISFGYCTILLTSIYVPNSAVVYLEWSAQFKANIIDIKSKLNMFTVPKLNLTCILFGILSLNKKLNPSYLTQNDTRTTNQSLIIAILSLVHLYFIRTVEIKIHFYRHS